MDVFSKIAEARPSMSKNQKKIADFIEKRYDEAIYLTAVRLSREVGVSEATIIRFAEKLGYEGYPEFQRALLEASKPILTSGQRMNVFHNMKSRGGTLPTVLASDSESIRRMLDTVDPKAFRRASDMISVSQG
ncbi:MAG: MurR/RpiR family transcriptional regulator, partial [Oscillospiraceae bacterium]